MHFERHLTYKMHLIIFCGYFFYLASDNVRKFYFQNLVSIPGIFAIQFAFCIFSLEKKSRHIFNGRIRFYFYPTRLLIDTGTRLQKEKLPFILQMNKTEPLIITATNFRCWATFDG